MPAAQGVKAVGIAQFGLNDEDAATQMMPVTACRIAVGTTAREEVTIG